MFVYELSGFAPASRKEFLEIQATIKCGFTLKGVRDMARTCSQLFIRIFDMQHWKYKDICNTWKINKGKTKNLNKTWLDAW